MTNVVGIRTMGGAAGAMKVMRLVQRIGQGGFTALDVGRKRLKQER